MDYFKIGQNIRKYRKEKNFSQEELAEKVFISTTHMSHIETGSTKLSLPVLVDLAKVLNVSTDEILNEDFDSSKAKLVETVEEVISSCSPKQAEIIKEIIISTKNILDKNI